MELHARENTAAFFIVVGCSAAECCGSAGEACAIDCGTATEDRENYGRHAYAGRVGGDCASRWAGVGSGFGQGECGGERAGDGYDAVSDWVDVEGVCFTFDPEAGERGKAFAGGSGAEAGAGDLV